MPTKRQQGTGSVDVNCLWARSQSTGTSIPCLPFDMCGTQLASRFAICCSLVLTYSRRFVWNQRRRFSFSQCVGNMLIRFCFIHRTSWLRMGAFLVRPSQTNTIQTKTKQNNKHNVTKTSAFLTMISAINQCIQIGCR